MWGLDQGLHLWVCQQSVSMRYGIRGLTQMVWSWKGHSPVSGDVYVFFSRDRKTMKALKWDGDGFLMYTKRLSQGRFREIIKKGDCSGYPEGAARSAGGAGCKACLEAN